LTISSFVPFGNYKNGIFGIRIPEKKYDLVENVSKNRKNIKIF